MNLILQGTTTDRSPIDRIAALAKAQRIVPLSAHAWRCEGVNSSPALKAEIEAACLGAQLDCCFIESSRTLADSKLLVMDMDSTLITIECIDEIATCRA